ncbi:MAG: hypothetical protein M1827_005594 [Pycnora praestabilis]|nr:MAG: hypothetical protein M1827_005594 [Pycnora praestabilis]
MAFETSSAASLPTAYLRSAPQPDQNTSPHYARSSSADSKPTLQVDTKSTRSNTVSSAISGASTFYSALGMKACEESLGLDHTPSIAYPQDSERTNMARSDSGFSENDGLIVREGVEHRKLPASEKLIKASEGDIERFPSSSGRISSEKTPKQVSGFHPESAASTRSNSHHRGRSKPSSSRYSSSHQTTSRRSSTQMVLPISKATRPNFERSLTSFRQPHNDYSSYSFKLPDQRRSASYSGLRPDSPTTLHYKSCHLFHSLGSTLGSHNSALPSHRTECMVSESLPFLPHYSSSVKTNTTPTTPPTPYAKHVSDDEDSIMLHIPATIIDWTSPSTRRREYEKIDKRSRGLRGWWRRIAPQWCSGKACRSGFYDEDNGSDAGSVRRYRLDLPDYEEEDEKGFMDEKRALKVGLEEKGEGRRTRPTLEKISKSWSCFSFCGKSKEISTSTGEAPLSEKLGT